MRTITQIHNATQFNKDKKNMQLFRIIGSTDIDGGGVRHTISAIDPFIFLDDAMIEGKLATSFSKHPHTGLTAISYLLTGTSRAWDNIYGTTPKLNHAGGVYCINSGRGVVHGEAPTEGIQKLRLLQLWFNPGIYNLPLPKADYQLFQPDELPIYEDDKLWVKIIIGAGFGYNSPVVSFWPIQYLHIKLKMLQNYSIPLAKSDWQGFIYVIEGNGEFGINKIPATAQQCLILGSEISNILPIKNLTQLPLEFILAIGKVHHQPFVKLLGHGGAIVADSEQNARRFMQDYEKDPENFGCK